MSEASVYVNINGDVREASSVDVPKDRTFRSAWQFSGNAIEIDMVKAREIHRDNLRRERAPLLSKLDVDVIRADEEGDALAKADAVAKKRALRDVTSDERIEAAQTAEELKVLTLQALLK
jgi:hypothetical protein